MIDVREEKSEARMIKSMLCQWSVKQEKFHPLLQCADRSFRTTRNPRHLTLQATPIIIDCHIRHHVGLSYFQARGRWSHARSLN